MLTEIFILGVEVHLHTIRVSVVMDIQILLINLKKLDIYNLRELYK